MYPKKLKDIYFLFYNRYLDAGRDFVASLQYGAKCPCGYCHITDVELHKQEDHMESFFLAETVNFFFFFKKNNYVSQIWICFNYLTCFFCISKIFQVKYLWLLFDLAVDSDNLVDNGPYK